MAHSVEANIKRLPTEKLEWVIRACDSLNVCQKPGPEDMELIRQTLQGRYRAQEIRRKYSRDTLEGLSSKELYGLLLELAASGKYIVREDTEKEILSVLRQREDAAGDEQRQLSPEELKALVEQYGPLREKMTGL